MTDHPRIFDPTGYGYRRGEGTPVMPLDLDGALCVDCIVRAATGPGLEWVYEPRPYTITRNGRTTQIDPDPAAGYARPAVPGQLARELRASTPYEFLREQVTGAVLGVYSVTLVDGNAVCEPHAIERHTTTKGK